MKKQKSIKLNFIMNALLTMSQFIFPLITFPYVSRVLLPAGTGKVSFATSFVSYFSMFAQLGIPTYGIRACAKVRDNKEELSCTVHELFIINMFMTVISYAVFFVMLATVPRLREEKLLYLIVSMAVLCNTLGVEWLYKALEQYTYITIRSIVFKAISVIAMFLLIHEQSDYVIYGAISIFASSASYLFNFANAHRYVYFHKVGKYDFKRHMKPIAVFFAMACATTIYTHLDTVMLGFMATDTDVGYYNAAVKIKTILVSVVTSLGTVLLPRASYYVQNGLMQEYRKITRKAIDFAFVLATPLVLYFIFFAKQGIYFLSGTAYAGSILPMQIIMPTLLVIGISNVTGIQMLVPTGREKVVLYSEIAGAVVDVIINAILIPRYTSAGAAIGTLVAECVVLGVQLFYLRNEINEIFNGVYYGKIILALILGSAASLWCTRIHQGSFIVLLISACLFFGVYGGVLLLMKEPLVSDIFNQVVGKVFKKEGK